MADLSQLTSPSADRPIIVTLVGDGGMGKTTLAATFPNPVFIRTEDGTQSLVGNNNVALFPLAKTSQEVLDQIEVLATQEHNFKTLVIDSITQLHTIFEAEVIANDPKAKSINQANGGYGAGWNTVAEMHRKFREWCGFLSEKKGMNIVFIAHADSETVELPDQDPYTRYTVRLHKKSVQHYSDNVDAVGFIKMQTFTRGDGERKRATSTGVRILTCYPTASHISKNRFGITEDITLSIGENPFNQFLPTTKKGK
jgi:phage nucleotide-binding protein